MTIERNREPRFAGQLMRLFGRLRAGKWLLTCTMLAGAVTCCAAPAPAAKPSIGLLPDAKKFSEQIHPFLEHHCFECHSGAKVKGDLHLDQLTTNFIDRPTLETWIKMLERVQAGEMPPKKKPRPEQKDIDTLAAWMSGPIQAAAAGRRAAEGRVVLRRLNRNEYQNTIRDLLGVEIDLVDLLPLDSSGNGFDNVGDALHTSSFLMEKYLEAADAALSEAIVNRPQPKTSKKQYLLKDSHQVRSSEEHVYRQIDDGTVLFSSSAWNAVGVTGFYPNDRGRYRFRISASAIQSAGKPVTFRVSAGSGGMGGAKGHLVGYFDAIPDKPTVFEWIDHVEPHTGISLLPYGLAGAQQIKKLGADKWDGPGVFVQWIEIEGPLNESWPPPSHRAIFGDLRQAKAPNYNHSDRVEVVSSDPVKDAQSILRNFARRAFRRNVTDADVKPYIELFKAKMGEKRTFEQAIRASLLAILISPDFLFFNEKPGRLDDFALANRLSYFFWSSMPDDELFTLAEQHKLSQPQVLDDQVERLLKDTKSAAFTKNFLGQWLALRDIDFTVPSFLLYPEFDDMLKASMVRETEAFFEEILKKDLSITNFISSDFSMLNGRLAKHYGIPGIDGWEFQKVHLPEDSHRGGLLTMASVLKVTANGTSTSPVLRGAWVLDRILGTPPPRPPANVAALEPDIRGATTIREQLAKHRQVAMCASCHVKIDPPGFAMESFDVIGGWRDNYRVTGNGKAVVINGRHMPYHTGKPVDCADELPDGRKFANIDEFKKLLLTQKEQVARSLTEKLLTYATGAPPEVADRLQVDAIVKKDSQRDYGLRSLVHEIVQSELFRTK
jgi:hypothetical protein